MQIAMSSGPLNLLFAAAFITLVSQMPLESKELGADLVLKNGIIRTLDRDRPKAGAVAVKDGRIIFVGDVGGVLRYEGARTKIIDLDGAAVIPGLTDAHAHVVGLGHALAELDLKGTTSPEQIKNMVRKALFSLPPGAWLSGRGWDQNDWETKVFPLAEDLEGTEKNPVFLRRIDGHAVWINKKALEVCGINKDTPDPKGGRIVRDVSGNPTGIFVDNAVDIVLAGKPHPTFAEKLEWARMAIKECNRWGIVCVHDAGVDSVSLEIYRELYGRGELTLRIYAMLDPANEAFFESCLDTGPHEEANGFITVRAVKLYADGALGSRGAALLEPYSDAPEQKGFLVNSAAEIQRVTEAALSHGFQVCIHAIGDAANRMVLDVYEKALSKNPVKDPRLRIEHAQVISPDDMARFGRLGVIPSMQPTHATSDMQWAEERLGSRRIKGAYAWRKLIEGGSRIPCGSDFPVEAVDPLKGIYAAVTRQEASGKPSGGWYPRERMTIEEAVGGFTLNAAFAAFAEKSRGSITIGKLADFTVLDKDIFTCAPKDIPDVKVLYTIVGGKIVYAKKKPH